MTDFLEELQCSLQRTEYGLRLLRNRGEQWEFIPEEEMYEFQGLIDPFLMKKAAVDLVREVCHLGDGIAEWINYRWKDGSLKAEEKFLTDKKNGPGRPITREHTKTSRSLQLCGDLANLSKHYKLTRQTQTEGEPPTFGDSVYILPNAKKIGYSNGPARGMTIKLDQPVSINVTMLVQDSTGETVGNVVDIATEARDSWLSLLKILGIEFEIVE